MLFASYSPLWAVDWAAARQWGVECRGRVSGRLSGQDLFWRGEGHRWPWWSPAGHRWSGHRLHVAPRLWRDTDLAIKCDFISVCTVVKVTLSSQDGCTFPLNSDNSVLVNMPLSIKCVFFTEFRISELFGYQDLLYFGYTLKYYWHIITDILCLYYNISTPTNGTTELRVKQSREPTKQQ